MRPGWARRHKIIVAEITVILALIGAAVGHAIRGGTSHEFRQAPDKIQSHQQGSRP